MSAVAPPPTTATTSSSPPTVMPGPDYGASARCPTCAHRGPAIIVSTSTQTVGMLFLYLVFCISCACCFLFGAKDRGLVYYCERCGLRLVTEDSKGSRVQYDDETLVSNNKREDGSHEIPGAKVARSPLGLPSRLNRSEVVNIKTRYRDLVPVRKLWIEKGRFGLPAKVEDSSSPTALTYIIESPGIPPAGPGDEKEAQFLQRRCAWISGSDQSHQRQHLKVSSQGQNSIMQELAWVRLFGTGNWDAELHVAHDDRSPHSTQGDEGGKRPFVERRMYAAEESDWATGGPGILWASSEGLLLWSMRTLKDAEQINVRALCLLDAYDRLVVALRKTRRPGASGKMWEMRVYVEVSEVYMGEILASYTALRCQLERIRQEHIYDTN